MVVLDAHLLLGKLHYAMGMYEEALKHYQQAELHTLTEKPLPCRSLRIIAESYAIKGLHQILFKSFSTLLVCTSALLFLIPHIIACQLNKGMIYIYHSLLSYIFHLTNFFFNNSVL